MKTFLKEGRAAIFGHFRLDTGECAVQVCRRLLSLTETRSDSFMHRQTKTRSEKRLEREESSALKDGENRRYTRVYRTALSFPLRLTFPDTSLGECISFRENRMALAWANIAWLERLDASQPRGFLLRMGRGVAGAISWTLEHRSRQPSLLSRRSRCPGAPAAAPLPLRNRAAHVRFLGRRLPPPLGEDLTLYALYLVQMSRVECIISSKVFDVVVTRSSFNDLFRGVVPPLSTASS